MAQLLTRPARHDIAAPPIQLQGVTVRYDSNFALRDVSFNLPAGQLTAVVGPNGAGKTTLFKIVVGAMSPTSGSVHVYGHGPGGHTCIAYVPQRSQVDWSFPVTVTEVVMMGRIRKIGFFHWPRPRDWRFVREALDRVGMAEFGGRHIGELSGGQQQRVFLAQAIAQEAEVVLLDEPFTGLDLPSQETIFSVLDELKLTGAAVMVAMHDLNLAAERFDQVMLLNRRLVAFGTPGEVFTRATLLEAYGDSLHVIPEQEMALLLADTCCEGDEELHQHE